MHGRVQSPSARCIWLLLPVPPKQGFGHSPQQRSRNPSVTLRSSMGVHLNMLLARVVQHLYFPNAEPWGDTSSEQHHQARSFLWLLVRSNVVLLHDSRGETEQGKRNCSPTGAIDGFVRGLNALWVSAFRKFWFFNILVRGNVRMCYLHLHAYERTVEVGQRFSLTLYIHLSWQETHTHIYDIIYRISYISYLIYYICVHRLNFISFFFFSYGHVLSTTALVAFLSTGRS